MNTMAVNNMLTVAEAAQEFGVTRQRMHILFRDYDVKTVRVNARCLLVTQQELRKVPKDRPNGIKKTG